MTRATSTIQPPTNVPTLRYLARCAASPDAWATLDRLDEIATALTEAADELESLRREKAGDDAFARSVNEALNMGDGSYRP